VLTSNQVSRSLITSGDRWWTEQPIPDGKGRRDYPFLKGVKYLSGDNLQPPSWIGDHLENHALYLTVWDGEDIVGARKFYVDPRIKQELNRWLKHEGKQTIKGEVWTSGYITVKEGYKRKGIGSMMQDLILELMRKGDVFQFGSHEPDGVKLNTAWMRKNKSKSKIHVFDSEYGMYTDYEAYDPHKKNFVIKDRWKFSSPRWKGAALRGRLIRLAASMEQGQKQRSCVGVAQGGIKRLKWCIGVVKPLWRNPPMTRCLILVSALLLTGCPANTTKAEEACNAYAATNYPGWDVVNCKCEKWDSDQNSRTRCNLSVKNPEDGDIKTPDIECPSSLFPQFAADCQTPKR